MYNTNDGFYGIEPVAIYELKATRQKSYYGKAKIIKDKSGKIFLQSYNTLVCYIDTNGEFKRLWNGYSTTTMRHIDEFRTQFGFPAMNKKEWNEL